MPDHTPLANEGELAGALHSTSDGMQKNEGQPISEIAPTTVDFPYDFHVHCGAERAGHAQIEFVKALQAHGIRRAGLLDHYEFYRGDRSPWFMTFRKDATRKGFEVYPDTFEGMQLMYDQLFALREEVELDFAIGIEFRRPAQIEDCYLERPEYITNCFHINDAPAGGSFGECAATLIRSFGERVRPFGKQAIVNHPFRDCLGPYGELLEKNEAPPPEAYFPSDEVHRMADAAEEYDLVLEINMGDINYHAPRHPALFDLMVHLHAALGETGLPLCLGSDAHQPEKLFPHSDSNRVLRQAQISIRHLCQISSRCV